MSVDVVGLTSAGRTLAEQLMADVGRLSTPGVGYVIDPETGDSVPTAATVYHEGPCRIRMPSLLEHEQLAGDTQVTAVRMVATFPATIPMPKVGDLLDVLDSVDPRVVALSFRVTTVAARTVLMYRQLGLEIIEHG